MKWFLLPIEEIEQNLNVSSDHGLSTEQVKKRQEQFGYNVVTSDKPMSKWLILLNQFQDFMVLVLLLATLVAGLLGEYIDAMAIIVIVLVNGLIGFFQEQKAETSLEKLKELSSPVAQVLRNGEWQRVLSKDLVVGDVIRLTTGDRIAADLRIIQANDLETEEAALTGESLSVTKHASALTNKQLAIQDQTNMGFMGTLVTRGTGIGIVTGTGMQTVMGQIATLMTNTPKMMTPLERRLAELGKILIVICLFLTAMVFAIGVFQGHPVYDMFLAAVSLAVAAIPEGLPAIVTVVLSLGVQRMIKRKAIVRKLSAVETLGCTSVICSDKTGTITENEMTVKQIFLNGDQIDVSGEGYQLTGKFHLNHEPLDQSYPHLKQMLLYGALCNDATLTHKQGKYVVNGDPTDGALLVAARKWGIDEAEQQSYKVIKEFPFDSKRKRMSIVIEDQNQMRFLITKGAPEILLARSSFYLDHEGRQLIKDTQFIENEMNRMANQALRTIAICMKPLKKETSLEATQLEKKLTFIGLYGMIDPPRKEVKAAIADCKAAGIKTVMITGDHVKTAAAIARQVGLLPDDGRVIEGYQLNQMSTDELQETIDDTYVFARVTPEHKLKIVNAFQANGHIVAMTGDGVNDAPAIKASDIGISMGITGTDVTKEASSLILMDDNFATIRDAINEGRNIYENIRKFVRYLLASNVGEILVMLFAMLLGYPLPLVPVQILWVNLVTDGLPAMALGLDRPEANTMKENPRDPREGIFARGLGVKIISRGFLIGLMTMLTFIFIYDEQLDNLTYARTIAFATLVLAQLIHVFDCRSAQSVFSRNPFENMYVVFAVLSSLLLLLVVIYWEPLQPIFHTESIQLKDWLMIIVFSAIPTVLFGIHKRQVK